MRVRQQRKFVGEVKVLQRVKDSGPQNRNVVQWSGRWSIIMVGTQNYNLAGLF